MSAIYGNLIGNAVDLVSGASADAAYDQAFAAQYNYQMQLNAHNRAKAAAEANLAAVKQDQVNADRVVRMQQDQAEAQAKVNAAFRGVEGQSQEDILYQTEVNAAFATANNRAIAEQGIEQQKANVYNAQISTPLAPEVVTADPMQAFVGSIFEGGFEYLTMSQEEIDKQNAGFDELGKAFSSAFSGVFLPTE